MRKKQLKIDLRSEQINQLALLARTDEKARSQLVLAFVGYIKTICYRIGTRTPKEDLFQEAQIGLISAISEFNPKRSCFLQCAQWYIRARILKFISEDKIIRIPMHIINEQAHEQGFYAQDTTSSLDLDLHDSSFLETYIEKSSNSSSISVEPYLSELKPRARDIVEMYYGIGYDFPFGITFIAEKWSLSEDGIRKILQKVLKKMKNIKFNSENDEN